MPGYRQRCGLGYVPSENGPEPDRVLCRCTTWQVELAGPPLVGGSHWARRMRENRMSGGNGGSALVTGPFYPLNRIMALEGHVQGKADEVEETTYRPDSGPAVCGYS